MSERYALTPLEIAAARCFGTDAEVPPLPELPAGQTPLAALEDALLPALRRPPCLVAFSGGRDSSALLAVAARLARREGLAPPVPLTLRMRDAPLAEEADWQELVLQHLELDDWQHVELGDELDFVGAAAQQLLRRHGLLWPANLHFFVPLLERATGGTLVSGVGGDLVLASGTRDLMGDSFLRAAPRLAARRAYRSLPAPARRPYAALRVRREKPWMTPAAAAMFTDALLRLAPEPPALDARLDHHCRQRPQVLTRYGLDLLAADHEAQIVHPLYDPGFVAAFGRFLGRDGVGGRTAVMRALFGELLPEAVLARPTKATFKEAFCGPHTRALVQGWDGSGLDPELVDADALRRYWGDGSDFIPLGWTALLIQAVWLGSATAGTLGSSSQSIPDRKEAL